MKQDVNNYRTISIAIFCRNLENYPQTYNLLFLRFKQTSKSQTIVPLVSRVLRKEKARKLTSASIWTVNHQILLLKLENFFGFVHLISIIENSGLVQIIDTLIWKLFNMEYHRAQSSVHSQFFTSMIYAVFCFQIPLYCMLMILPKFVHI